MSFRDNNFKFRVDVLAQHSMLSEKLKQLQSECEGVKTIKDMMDLGHVVEQKETNNSISMKLMRIDEEVQKVSILMERFAQYLPTEPYRKAVEASTQDILEQFLCLVKQTNKRTELLNLVAPHLQRYLTSAGEVKTWLAHAEARCKYLTSLSITSMNCEAVVEKLVEEMIEKKITHDAMVLAYRGVVVVDGMEQFFNIHSNNLAKDKSGVLEKWENVKETLTKYLSATSTEKRTQVDNQLKMECHHCCCSTPYEIKKVGENRYTFGTSKTIRMVRQHGQSIVVRVGGGWEYLINFLSKVDPCRAQEHSRDYMDNGEITIDNDVVLKSMNGPDDSFQQPIVRLSKSAMPAKKKAAPTKKTIPKTTKVATIAPDTSSKRAGMKKKPASKFSLKPTPLPRSFSTSDDRVNRGRLTIPSKKRVSKSQSVPLKDDKMEVLEISSVSTAESEESLSEMIGSSPYELPDELFVINDEVPSVQIEIPLESVENPELETIAYSEDGSTPAESEIEKCSRSSALTKEDEEISIGISPELDDEHLGQYASPPTIQIKKSSTSSTSEGKVPVIDHPPTPKAPTKEHPQTPKPSRKDRSKRPIAPTRDSPTTVKEPIKDSTLINPGKSSKPTLQIPVSRTRGRSTDFIVGRAPSPLGKSDRTPKSQKGRSNTAKTLTTAAKPESVPKTSSSPRAASASKRQRSLSANVLDFKGTPPKSAITAAKGNARVGAKAEKSSATSAVKPKSHKTASTIVVTPSFSITSSENVKKKRSAKRTPLPNKDDGEGIEKSDTKTDEQCIDNGQANLDAEASPTNSIITVEIPLHVDQETCAGKIDSSVDIPSPTQQEEPSSPVLYPIKSRNRSKETKQEGDDEGPNAGDNDNIQADSLTSPAASLEDSAPKSLLDELPEAEIPSAKSKEHSSKNVSESSDEDLSTVIVRDQIPHITFSVEPSSLTPHDTTGPEMNTELLDVESSPLTVELVNEVDEELLIIDFVDNPESCPSDIKGNNVGPSTVDSLTDVESLSPSTEATNNIEKDNDVSVHEVNSNVEINEDDVFVTDLFNTPKVNDDLELTVPGLFATGIASEDGAAPEELSYSERKEIATTRTNRGSSFEYITDIDFAKVPLEDMQMDVDTISHGVSEDVDVRPENIADTTHIDGWKGEDGNNDAEVLGRNKYGVDTTDTEGNMEANDFSSILADLEMEVIEINTNSVPKGNTKTASVDNTNSESEESKNVASEDNTNAASETEDINNNSETIAEYDSKEELVLEDGLDLIDTEMQKFSHKILESIVESGQHFLDSIECEDGTTGERTTLTIESSTPMDSMSLELSSKSVDSPPYKPPVNAPAETWVVF